MQLKQKERILAQDLRKEGLSYNEIRKQINVSKSTLSLWCRNIKLNPKQSVRLFNNSMKSLEENCRVINKIRRKQFDERIKSLGITAAKIQKFYWQEKFNVRQIAEIFKVRDNCIYNLMRKYNIPRRGGTDVNYLIYKYKPQFKVKDNLTLVEEKLKIAGIMLYWAEGAKNSAGINFSNSDPKMIQLFLAFLRLICGIDNSRLRVHLYAYSNQNLDKIKAYWQKITDIPFNQFNKPYIRENNPNKNGRKLSNGLIQVRYNDKRLLELIKLWIDEYLANDNWAGGGVANRTRL